MSKTLAQRMQASIDWLMPQAQAVSNMNKPESDNMYGATATALREAMSRIKRLEDEVKELEGELERG